MRKVEHYINEKFTEDSDPIVDLNIGIFIKKDFKDVETCLKSIMIAIPAILNTEVIPRNIVPADHFGKGLQPNYYRKIQDFLDKYWTFNGKKFDGSIFNGNRWPWELREELLKRGFKKSSKLLLEQYQVNEKFTEDSDPIHDMNIGMFQIKKVFLDPKKAASFLITILPEILKKEEIPKDILIRRSSSEYVIRGEYITSIIKYAQKYIINKSRSSEPDIVFQYGILIELENILTEMGYPRKRKKIKESLNEKFTEDSDPVSDLGIGMIGIYKNLKRGDVLQLKKNLGDTYFKGNYILIFDVQNFQDNAIPAYNKKFSFLKFNDKEQLLNYNNAVKSDFSFHWWYMNYSHFKKWFEYIPKSKLLNEKFIEDGDPIKDLEIGLITLRLHPYLDTKDGIFITNEMNPVYIVTRFKKFLKNNNITYKIIKDSTHETWPEIDFTGAKSSLIKMITETPPFEYFARSILQGKDTIEDIFQRNRINEKFTEEGDPIHDMGIGIFAHRSFKSMDEFYDFLVENIQYILKINEIPEVFMITTSEYSHCRMKTKYHDKLQDYLDVYITIDDSPLSRKRISMSEIAKRMKKGIRISTTEEMKGERNLLSEKFIEDSDPIQDMGIGLFNKPIDFKSYPGMFAQLSKMLPAIIGTKTIPRNILNDKDPDGWYIHHKYSDILMDYVKTYFTIKGQDVYYLPKEFHRFLKKKYPRLKSWMIKDSVNEKFAEDSDPIHDLGIGYPELVKIWEKEKYRIGPQNTDITYAEYFPDDKNTTETYRHIVIMIIYYTLVNIMYSKSFNEHQQIFNKAIKDAEQTRKEEIQKIGINELKKKAADILNNRFDTRIDINEKFIEDSDPIKDMGIGIQIEKYERDLLSYKLDAMTPSDFSKLRKRFNLNPKKDLYYITSTNDHNYDKVKTKVKKIIRSAKKIFEVAYNYMVDRRNVPTLLTVYETEMGKIGTFSYPGKNDLIQYFGDISSFIDIKGR